MSNEAKALKQQGGKKIDLQKLLALGALVILFVFFFIAAVFRKQRKRTHIYHECSGIFLLRRIPGARRNLCNHHRRDRPLHRDDYDVRRADRRIYVQLPGMAADCGDHPDGTDSHGLWPSERLFDRPAEAACVYRNAGHDDDLPRASAPSSRRCRRSAGPRRRTRTAGSRRSL